VPGASSVFPDRATALRYGLRLGCISFGGPAGQIAILYREVVEARRWIGAEEFARALNFCMLLPGPEALQLVIYLGWRWHGTGGGVVAGLLFLLPAALLLTGLSFVYVLWGTLLPVAGVLAGLKAVVLALIAEALARIGRRALRGPAHVALAAAALVALSVLGTPFPLLLGAAALIGALAFPATPAAAAGPRPAAAWRHSVRVALVGLGLWLAPWLILRAAAADPFLAHVYRFFTAAALLTFGGAYAVLAYVNHELAATLGWLSPPQLLAGLALAETTPGPLVLVLQFYGFVAGWNHPGTLAAGTAALWSAGLASWATFLPSFVLVLAGAPFVERLTASPRLTGALAAVTAAVVGVIASFGLAVAAAVLVPRGLADPDWLQAAIAVAALAALWRGADLGWVLAGGAAVGLCARLGGGG
jgi:chromate transporter